MTNLHRLILILLLFAPAAASAAWSPVGQGTACTTGTNDDTLTAADGCTMPSHSTGDVLLACWAASDGNNDMTMLLPSGWSWVQTEFEDPGLQVSHSLIGKIASSGSESFPTLTLSGTADGGTVQAAQVVSFSGGTLTVHAQDTDNGATASGDITSTALTITEDDTVVIDCGMGRTGWTSVDDLSGSTELGEVSTVSGNDVGLVWNYQIQTTATSVSSRTWTVNGFTAQFSDRMSIVASLSAAGAGVTAPSITSALACDTLDASGFNCKVTFDEDSTGHMVACRENSTKPTPAQVKSGDCTGDVAALEYETTSLTGTVEWDAHFTGLAARIAYDVYVVATNAGGDSADDCDGTPTSCDLSQPRGSQFTGGNVVQLTSITADDWVDCANDVNCPTNNPTAYWGAGNTVAIDDWVDMAGVTDPDPGGAGGLTCNVLNNADGTITVEDCDTSVRSIEFCVQDATDGDMFADVGATLPGQYVGCPDKIWLNNDAPVCDEDTVDVPIQTGEAFSLDFNDECTDSNGHALTAYITSGTDANGLTPGSAGNMVLSGTVADIDEDETGNSVTRRFYDTATDYYEVTHIQWPINTTQMPDLDGLDIFEQCMGSGAILIGPPHFYECTGSFSCDRDYAQDTILSQTPAPTTELEIGAAVSAIAQDRGICLKLERRRQ